MAASPDDDEPIEAQLAPPPARKWHQFSLAKLMLAMALSGLTFALVSGAFRAVDTDYFPIYVLLAALAPLPIVVLFGLAHGWLRRDRRPRRQW